MFPEPWARFRRWYNTVRRTNHTYEPLVDGLVSSAWYRAKRDRIWTPWFIKWTHLHGMFCLYFNLAQARSLTVSHREPGVNTHVRMGRDATLWSGGLDEVDSLLLRMPATVDLAPRFDFCFHRRHPGVILTPANVDDVGELLAQMRHIVSGTASKRATFAHSPTTVVLLAVDALDKFNVTRFRDLVVNWICAAAAFPPTSMQFLLYTDDEELAQVAANRHDMVVVFDPDRVNVLRKVVREVMHKRRGTLIITDPFGVPTPADLRAVDDHLASAADIVVGGEESPLDASSSSTGIPLTTRFLALRWSPAVARILRGKPALPPPVVKRLSVDDEAPLFATGSVAFDRSLVEHRKTQWTSKVLDVTLHAMIINDRYELDDSSGVRLACKRVVCHAA